jgi:hypothetical protein
MWRSEVDEIVHHVERVQVVSEFQAILLVLSSTDNKYEKGSALSNVRYFIIFTPHRWNNKRLQADLNYPSSMNEIAKIPACKANYCYV